MNNHTESFLKWAVILVIGFFALRWFTGLLTSVVDAGASTPWQGNVPYAPGGVVYPVYYGVGAWSPYHGRGRGSRWSYGGQ